MAPSTSTSTASISIPSYEFVGEKKHLQAGRLSFVYSPGSNEGKKQNTDGMNAAEKKRLYSIGWDIKPREYHIDGGFKTTHGKYSFTFIYACRCIFVSRIYVYFSLFLKKRMINITMNPKF